MVAQGDGGLGADEGHGEGGGWRELLSNNNDSQ